MSEAGTRAVASGASPGASVIPFPSAAATLQEVVERLRAGKCVLWAGSALEERAGGASFRGVVGKLLDQLPQNEETAEARELLKRRPFLIAGHARRALGDRFEAALHAATAGPAEVPAELKLLAELPFRAVVTTGFSDLLPRAFATAYARDGKGPVVYTPADAPTIAAEAGRKRYLLKALGEPSRSGSVVFSAKDLQAALGDDQLAMTVRDFHRHRSILFLGLDPAVDIDRMFIRMLQGTHDEGAEHYAVVAGLTRLEREELRSTYRIHVIEEADAFAFIHALRDAVGEHIESLPDDDDVEGWLGVLSADPERADALDKVALLEKRLSLAGEHERLLELHLGMAEIETSAAGRARRLGEVSHLFDRQFADPAKAFTAALASYQADPEHGSRDELERLAGVTGSWADLITEYQATTAHLPAALRPDHLAHVARLQIDKLNQPEAALATALSALGLDAKNHQANEVRLTALRRGEKFPELVAALGQAAAAEPSPAHRAELYLEQADVLETRLQDHAGAVKAYHAAAAADPGSTDALSALELLHRRRSEWKELVAVLEDKAKGAPVDKARELRLEAAAMVRDKLADKDGAIARYEALRQAGAGLEAVRALVALYDAAGKTDEYLDALAAEAAATPDAAARSAIYRRLAAEWEDREGGAGRAAEFLEKILAADPRNEDVLRHVERLYSAQQKWEALVDAYRRHLAVPGVDRVAMLGNIARVFERDLGDRGRAADAWEKVLAESPDSDDAMAALTRLHESARAWDKALALLDKRVERARDKESKARALYEAGRIAADQMGDVKVAEERYHKAMEIDPTFVPAMTSMVELYRKSGEFLRAARLLVEAEQHTSNRLDKTRFLVEAGEIYDSLEQPDTATELLLKALAVDPEHVEAANRVTDLLWDTRRYAELVPVLEMLTRKEADPQTTRGRLLRLGAAAREAGHSDKSNRAFLRAAEVDPTDVQAQREAGQILFADGRWEEARRAFQAVQKHGGERLEPAERVELFFRLGECERKLEHLEEAKGFYARALELDPTHRPTILALIDVQGDDPRKVVDSKRALLATATDDEKVKLLGEIGELSLTRLGDPAAAIAAFQQALAVKPDTRSLLHKALEVHVDQKQWPQALQMLDRLARLEQVPAVRAKLRFTSAAIHLEELGDRAAGIQLLGEAYDDDPGNLRVAQQLEDELLASQDWKELQRYYRSVLKNMRPDAEADTAEQRRERLRVWNAIADLSIDKLGELDVGLSALEVAATFDAGNIKRRERLADLYVEGGADYLDKAIGAHQLLLRQQPDRIPSYRALRALYRSARQPGKALAAAYALSFLQKGAAEDAELVSEAKRRPLGPVHRNLDDDVWARYLVHPDEDARVSQLFALLLPTLSLANGQGFEAAGLLRKDAVSATDGRGFAKGIRYVSAALDVTVPFETYVRYEQREALAVVNCVDKAQPVHCLLVGQPLLGEKRTETQLLYELAKRLSSFREGRFLRNVLPVPAQLGLVIDASIALGAEVEREKHMTGETTKVAQDFKRSLSPKALEQVQAIGKRLRGSRGLDLANAWLSASELTATRAALLLLGDLEATARFVAVDPVAVSSHPPVYRLKQLVAFSVSEECFALRKHMGRLD